MNINFTDKELNLLDIALETQLAATKRAANTEKDPTVKEIREKAYHAFTAVQNKLHTKEIDETPIGKQK